MTMQELLQAWEEIHRLPDIPPEERIVIFKAWADTQLRQKGETHMTELVYLFRVMMDRLAPPPPSVLPAISVVVPPPDKG